MHISNFRTVAVKDVIQIFARVEKQIPSIPVMVGDGPDRVEAETEARLGLNEKVFFSGRSTRSRRCLPAPICFCYRRAANHSG
jgi:hypothetical protein